MTSDETRHSVLRSNRNALWGVILGAILIVAVLGLSALTWGALLLIPGVLIVGVALAGTLWVIGLKGTRR
ncbi:MAG: hypothetical protein AB7F65_04155 [Dehalococcoidia bacterium]